MAVCGVVPVAAIVPLFHSIVHIPTVYRGGDTAKEEPLQQLYTPQA